jgi:hypothetical protein
MLSPCVNYISKLLVVVIFDLRDLLLFMYNEQTLIGTLKKVIDIYR